MRRQFDDLRYGRRGATPLSAFFNAARIGGNEYPVTPTLAALWTAASLDPRARELPSNNPAAAAFVAELLDALSLAASVAQIGAGMPLLHHPFDPHDAACVNDAFASAAQLLALARRLRTLADIIIAQRVAAGHRRTAHVRLPFERDTISIMLNAVVASTRCPQSRIAVYKLQNAVFFLLCSSTALLIARAARELEDAGTTYVVAPLRHAPGAPHVFPACAIDAEMRAAQLRLFAARPLDPRAPSEEDAPRTAAAAMHVAANAATCPAVREFLMNRIRAADATLPRTIHPRGLAGIADRLLAEVRT